MVLTIHDAIPNKYPHLIFAHRQSLLLWRLKLAYAVKRATVVATVSETAKQDIARAFRINENVISVVHGAVSPLFRFLGNRSESRQVVAAEYGFNPGDRFLLYVDGFGPHKSLPMLMDAFAALHESPDNNDLKLVLVGERSSFQLHHRALQSQVASRGLTDKAIFTGFVHEKHRVHFYNLATAFVTASMDEGFGLPPLEAMACGTPVVASRIGALKEVLGRAGRYFDPHDKMELATTLGAVLGNMQLRQEMAREGLLRSEVFSWGQSALTALKLFEQPCRQPSV